MAGVISSKSVLRLDGAGSLDRRDTGKRNQNFAAMINLAGGVAALK
jgi:hypothetical protein